ncbi:DUF5994 family protein [Uniformispora flossi]|uniref:DUF5994 family protein n=1 Tax=Uniformispora flossi TaxID=3390723 RepID=UPI003C2CD13C
MFDGAGWPRSDDTTEELPGLVAAVSAHGGRIVRAGIHWPHWHRIPHTVLIGGPPRPGQRSLDHRLHRRADPQPPRPSPAARRPADTETGAALAAILPRPPPTVGPTPQTSSTSVGGQRPSSTPAPSLPTPARRRTGVRWEHRGFSYVGNQVAPPRTAWARLCGPAEGRPSCRTHPPSPSHAVT